jgi:hypothetical protein
MEYHHTDPGNPGFIERMRQRARNMTRAQRIAAKNPDADIRLTMESGRGQGVQEAARPIESAGMERHPYSWHGTDRDGNLKSGQTQMRDKTVPAMVRGFWDADYQQLQITRDGTRTVGGITPANGFTGAMPWHDLHLPIGKQAQREPQ